MRPITFILACCLAGSVWADTLSGRATVIDGDTIEIEGERVRLSGIDAPESGQQCRDGQGQPWACGQSASFALDDFLAASRPTHCATIERDRWSRIVAICSRNDGADINAWLVREGWALDWHRYSGGAYDAAQSQAKAEGRGLWRGAFVKPWDWRQGARLDWGARHDPVRSNCVIKGNINAHGERIYHLPGGQFYDRTVVDESRGQRWFCSEAEARAAGWRRSRR